MRAALLLALMQGATASCLDNGGCVLNPFTDWAQPPPDVVTCSSNSDCHSNSACTSSAYCTETNGNTCMDTFGSAPLAGAADNACDDAQANGFVKCEGGTLHRHCSPSNRDGGNYDTSGLSPPPPEQVDENAAELLAGVEDPPLNPLWPPAPPPPPPEFSSQPEGMLFFGGCILIFMLIVCYVRASLRLPASSVFSSRLPAPHANRRMVLPARGRCPTCSTCAGRWIPISSRGRRPTRALVSKV